jgi:hypothetical protein
MVFAENDLVFYQKGGEIYSGGYKVDSLLMKKRGALFTDTNLTQNGGSEPLAISAALKEMAVPAGLLYIQQAVGNKYITENMDEPISSGLFDNLLDIVDKNADSNKTHTHKHKKNKRRKTHKNKK